MSYEIQCVMCGQLTELSDSNFNVREFCGCDARDNCEHGICNACRDVMIDQVEAKRERDE